MWFSKLAFLGLCCPIRLNFSLIKTLGCFEIFFQRLNPEYDYGFMDFSDLAFKKNSQITKVFHYGIPRTTYLIIVDTITYPKIATICVNIFPGSRYKGFWNRTTRFCSVNWNNDFSFKNFTSHSRCWRISVT